MKWYSCSIMEKSHHGVLTWNGQFIMESMEQSFYHGEHGMVTLSWRTWDSHFIMTRHFHTWTKCQSQEFLWTWYGIWPCMEPQHGPNFCLLLMCTSWRKILLNAPVEVAKFIKHAKKSQVDIAKSTISLHCLLWLCLKIYYRYPGDRLYYCYRSCPRKCT